MRKNVIASMCGVAFVGMSGIGNATIIDKGDFTYDQSTQRGWLDVTETINMSYSDTLHAMANGGTSVPLDAMANGGISVRGYDGSHWRYVTWGEVQGLFDNATGVTGDASGFRDLGDDNNDGIADTLTLDSSGKRRAAQIVDQFEVPTQSPDFTHDWSHEDTFSANYSRSWLVREHVSVPEPTILALMGLGLVGLAGMGYQRRRCRKSATQL